MTAATSAATITASASCRSRTRSIGWLGSALRRFLGDRRGASALEFGLVSAPFLATLCAIFELGYITFQNQMLANAVDSAARAMMTGNLQIAGANTKQQFIDNYLCQAKSRNLPSSFDCSRLIIDVRPAATFTAGNTSNDFYRNNDNKYCPGSPKQVVVLRVAYPLPAVFPLNLFNPSGTVSNVPGIAGTYHILMGAALFQTENFAGSYTPSASC